MGTFAKGQIFTLPAKQVTQDMINRYAAAASDFNPLHIDPEFARRTRYGGTVAHGMLSMAFLQELLTRAFGKSWLESGDLEVSFMAPVRPGEAITAEAKVLKAEPAEGTAGKQRLRLQVVCSNERGEKVIIGKAGVTAG